MHKNKAFTLAEILIALVIIGIVAAITLFIVIPNVQKEVAVERLKKTYSTLNNAMRKSQFDNGPFSEWETGEDIDTSIYFSKYWYPYLNHIQRYTSAGNLGYESDQPWKNLNGDRIGWGVVSSSTRVLFSLSDGTVVFYPINSTNEEGEKVFVTMFYIDVNGSKNPNVIGKDVFIFNVIDYGGIKPYCYGKSSDSIDNNCTRNSGGNYNCCTAKIMKDNWQIKSDYPW